MGLSLKYATPLIQINDYQDPHMSSYVNGHLDTVFSSLKTVLLRIDF